MNEEDDRPLISPRSPSYERARHEREHPAPPGEAQVIAVLGRLVEAEIDAARALQAAGGESAAQAAAHEGRAGRLGKMIEELGGSPPRPEECRAILAHGADEVGRAASEADRGQALRAMEDELADEYRHAARDPALSPQQRDALARLSAE